MQEIKNNPQVYTTQESMQEIKNYPQDVNTCFYKLNYLGCNLSMKFISFWNETHLKVVWGWTIRFLMLGGGGGGLLPIATMYFLPLSLWLIFSRVIAQPPPPPSRPLSCIKSLMVPSWYAIWSYNFLCDERIWIYMYYSCCCCFFYITKRISSDNFRK